MATGPACPGFPWQEFPHLLLYNHEVFCLIFKESSPSFSMSPPIPIDISSHPFGEIRQLSPIFHHC